LKTWGKLVLESLSERNPCKLVWSLFFAGTFGGLGALLLFSIFGSPNLERISGIDLAIIAILLFIAYCAAIYLYEIWLGPWLRRSGWKETSLRRALLLLVFLVWFGWYMPVLLLLTFSFIKKLVVV